MNKFHLASMGRVNSPPQITTGKWTQPAGVSQSVHMRDLTQCHRRRQLPNVLVLKNTNRVSSQGNSGQWLWEQAE